MVKKGIAITLCIATGVVGLSTASLFGLQAAGVVNLFADYANVSFRNYDDTLLYQDRVAVGANAVYQGVQPEKPSNGVYEYEFIGWDKPLTNVLVDTTFYARFQSKVPEFQVTFLNYDDTLLYSTYVSYGATAQYVGLTPTRESEDGYVYIFTGWDRPLDNIQEDTVFIAQYDIEFADHKVTFKNYDNSTLAITYVLHGEEAIYNGPTPVRPSTETSDYRFVGWDEDITSVKKDLIAIAQYEEVPLQYTVTFTNYDGTELYVDHVASGAPAIYEGPLPKREPDDHYSYEFTGWNKPISVITEDMLVIAQYVATERYFNVVFYNWDDTVLFEASAQYGEPAFYGGREPKRLPDEYYEYEFKGWDRDFSAVTEDLVVYAVYEKTLRSYTCTFKNENGLVLYATDVLAGETVVYLGPTPTKDTGYQTSWRFIGWDKELTNITADTVFIAQFENYQDGGGGSGDFRLVTFRDYDGTVLDYDLFEIGKDVPLYFEGEVDEHDNPIVPAREDTGPGPFTFVGWSIPLDVVAELPKTPENAEVTVFALYSHGVEGYPIVFYRSPVDEKTLLYEHFLYSFGATSYYGGPQEDFLNPDYGFTGWDHDLTNVTESFNTFPTYNVGGE